jgi:K+-sensing histidine kinase KdpD
MVEHETRVAWVPWRTAARAGAVVLPVVTCALLATVRDQVTAATGVLVLVLWVVGAAATGDRVAGLSAAVAAGASFDFFLTRPYLSLSVAKSDDVEATVLLVLISVAVTEVALWGRRQQAGASRRSGYLDGVLGAARAVAEGDVPAAAVAEVVARQISEVLDADSCHYVTGPVGDPRIALLDHDGVLTRNGRAVDVERVGLPWDEYVAIPVRAGARDVGHFVLTATDHVTYPSREQRRVAVLLADQVASAVEVR